MKPDPETLKARCPDLHEGLLKEHLSRLGERYFESFSIGEICDHLQALSRLSSEHPVEMLLDKGRDGSVACTVLAFDYPFEFSIITGVLAGMGYAISSGEVFTYARSVPKVFRGMASKKSSGPRAMRDPLHRRRIIDHFSGALEPPLSFKTWAAELRSRMEMVILLLERGDDSSVDEAKQRVNEMVTGRLARLHKDAH
jgi:hypothetical protein